MKIVRLILIPFIFLCLVYTSPVFAGKSPCHNPCADLRVAGFVKYAGAIPDAKAIVGVAGPGVVAYDKANFLGFFIIKNQRICCPQGGKYYTWNGSVFASSWLFRGATAYQKLKILIYCCNPPRQSLYVTLCTL